MRAAGERTVPAAAAAAAAFGALFFAGGSLAAGPLVWIGAIALVPAALALWWAPAQGGRAVAFLGCLWGLALWCGLSILWSASPDLSWGYTNQSLAYAAFATLGILVGPRLDRVAAAATVLVAAVVGWALLTKCIPSLYSPPDGVARLRAPIDEWNMLALVCVAGVPLALWLAERRRVAGVVLLYASVVALLLTYSRFGVALAVLAGVAWVVREDGKVERLADGVVATAAGAVVALVAASLNGITSNGQPHGVRVHDGWIFLLVLLAGIVAVSVAAAGLARLRPGPARRRSLERAAAVAGVLVVLAGVVVAGLEARTLWDSFTKPVAAQTTNSAGHLTQLGSGNRWQWWKEAWRGFTGHPLGGTGAGTFQFTDLRYRQSTDITAEEPHNTPLQFLSETGIVGFLLFVGAVAAALATRRRGPLPLVFAAFAAHSLVNYDWSFLAVSGPFLLVGGVVASEPRATPARRPLLALAAAVFALGVVYSFAAPWLSQRAWVSFHLDQAHSYDPLNTQVLADQAALSQPAQGERLFKEALQLEPTNANLWFELATFYAQNGAWQRAYAALSQAYVYDPFGPAGQCGIAQEIRKKAGAPSATCRGAGQPSIP